MKSYGECFEFIAEHANDVLPLFADGWSRFPAGEAVKQINARLSALENTYRGIGARNQKYLDYANTAREIITTIQERDN